MLKNLHGKKCIKANVRKKKAKYCQGASKNT